MIDTILSQLLINRDYFNKVWPYLKSDYFPEGSANIIYKSIKTHVDKYNTVPSKTVIEHDIESSSLKENQLKDSLRLLKNLSNSEENIDWLVDETERYAKQTAVYNATSKIIEIQSNAELPEDKRNKKVPEMGAILDIMKEAISVSFNTTLGHNWLDDAEERWLAYKNKTYKVPFKLNILNRITKGGVENATLNVLLAGVNVGKSMGMCSLAADYIEMGKNVLYFSMEMSEFACAKRIDANLLDIKLDDLDNDEVSYAEYKAKIDKHKANKKLGSLEIKAFGTGTASATTFRSYINELKLKKNFIPDVIFVDYLGICASSRIKVYSENSYILVKAIAEELRALAFEFNLPIWSAAQTTRGAWDSSEVNMSDVAESAGLAATCDFIMAVIETEELAEAGQQLAKQIKSRYGDKFYFNKFLLNVKKGNQKWKELDEYKKHTTEEVEKVQKSSKEKKESHSVRSKIDALVEEVHTEKKKSRDLKNVIF